MYRIVYCIMAPVLRDYRIVRKCIVAALPEVKATCSLLRLSFHARQEISPRSLQKMNLVGTM